MVSVIIPNYNHAQFLEQRLESVLNQTYQDFEVIILDDYSTDNSHDIIERYRNISKVSQIVYNETNSGSTFKQWQKGIDLAKGDWIWIAESDDWCEHNFLDVVLPHNDNEIVLSFCGSLMYKNNSIISYPYMKNLNEIIEGITFCRNHLVSNNSIQNASMCVFKKSSVNSISNALDFKLCGDWIIWIDIALSGKVKVSGRVLNYFRKHDNDVSSVRYADGTFHLEYVRIQNLLLNRGIIEISEYQLNIKEKFITISKFITNKKNRIHVTGVYNQVIGHSLFRFDVKFYLRRVFNWVVSSWLKNYKI
jgi:glycosyltransferase involved in cell wall biosynthesis